MTIADIAKQRRPPRRCDTASLLGPQLVARRVAGQVFDVQCDVQAGGALADRIEYRIEVGPVPVGRAR
ncbi:MAG: hypothetical protein HKN44_09705 [Ilumatobacter sp.]|nr:hypothetical protein [Ilumatobacter sp.]